MPTVFRKKYETVYYASQAAQFQNFIDK